MKKFLLIYRTIIHLKLIQIIYQIKYKIFKPKLKRLQAIPVISKLVMLDVEKDKRETLKKVNNELSFRFLNLYKKTKIPVDWNYNGYGKLWTYNLNYFDFLNDDEIDKKIGYSLIIDFIDHTDSIKDGFEAYPTSLRIINWIKFINKNKIFEGKINRALYEQVEFLKKNLEYHLLGNHLLENGFGLLFGAYYFQSSNLYNKAKRLINKQLNEQILRDGFHFEKSAMYHKIVLFRILECLNLIENNNHFQDKIFSMHLRKTASKMLNCLQTISFSNQNIPHVNDSTDSIAPENSVIFNYAKLLGLPSAMKIKLGESGYRKYELRNAELFLDVGNIGPDYQPGHAHSDTFSFELYLNEKPVIIDSGTSTYENNNIRKYERSTKAHNTVRVGNYEQSEVWHAFRVARRAKVNLLSENKNHILAQHNGYKRIGATHVRSVFIKENEIIINDKVLQLNKKHSLQAYLHFHPDIKFQVTKDKIKGQNFVITFEGLRGIITENYYKSYEFNKRIKGICCIISFESILSTKIHLS